MTDSGEELSRFLSSHWLLVDHSSRLKPRSDPTRNTTWCHSQSVCDVRSQFEGVVTTSKEKIVEKSLFSTSNISFFPWKAQGAILCKRKYWERSCHSWVGIRPPLRCQQRYTEGGPAEELPTRGSLFFLVVELKAASPPPQLSGDNSWLHWLGPAREHLPPKQLLHCAGCQDGRAKLVCCSTFWAQKEKIKQIMMSGR